VLQLPGGITSLAGGSLGMINEGQVLAGSINAVTSLHAIGTTSSLEVAGNSMPLSISGNLTSAGGLDVGDYYSGGSLTLGGSYTALPGSQTSLGAGSNLKATQIDLQAGSGFSAGGQTVIQGSVNNAGSFSVGGVLVSIAGDFTQTSSGSLGAGGGFELGISGHANLAGALDAAIGIEPQQGTRTTALTFASRTGDFTSHSLGIRILPGATQIDVVTQPQIQATPASATPGSTVVVSGGDFPYASTVTIYLDHTGGTPLGSVSVGNIHGAFSTSVSVPAGTLLGAHRIIAVDGTITATARITVT
jgi:hypothetical protein